KAHPDVFNLLLQVLDDGRLTDSNGRTVDFRNTIIVMTSNVGARELQDQRFVGFGGPAEDNYENVRSTMMKELKNSFRPEFINRVDDIIVFHKLEKEHLKEIVSLMIDQLRERLTDQNIHIEVTEKATERIAEEGYDPEYGARPLARSIQKNIEDTLSESLLSGESFENKLVTVDYKKDKFTVKTKDKVKDTVEQ
ncbi:MAG: AAA family ATPase, partial [Jeotgalicoccus sp.]|nr:AAA family ATPase [Jeotgalicoccus sp.]